jgi:hypothetical protein
MRVVVSRFGKRFDEHEVVFPIYLLFEFISADCLCHMGMPQPWL